jgi:hypothetical protein
LVRSATRTLVTDRSNTFNIVQSVAFTHCWVHHESNGEDAGGLARLY